MCKHAFVHLFISKSAPHQEDDLHVQYLSLQETYGKFCMATACGSVAQWKVLTIETLRLCVQVILPIKKEKEEKTKKEKKKEIYCINS